ncbi:MAG: hypothetical protein M5U34_32405 [Chloroflexi bacterium]|nr:hypothetical protein [Chloroflexota bacterium]
MLKGWPAITFHGTSEWALDHIFMEEVVWMPTEEQLRQELVFMLDRLVEKTELMLKLGKTAVIPPPSPSATARSPSQRPPPVKPMRLRCSTSCKTVERQSGQRSANTYVTNCPRQKAISHSTVADFLQQFVSCSHFHP